MNADTWFSAISTTRFVVVVLAVATLFTLYVGHVFATQKLLTEVQQLRSEELALQMNRDKLEGDYQRVIGPTTIFSEATKLGLKDRAQFGEPIRLP